MMSKTELMLAPDVARLIHSVRNQRIIFDADLAGLYGVPTKRLNEQYRRNLDRFPGDFAFRLTPDEWAALRSQIATLTSDPNLKSQNATSSFSHGGRRKLPVAFTEHGALMAAMKRPALQICGLKRRPPARMVAGSLLIMLLTGAALSPRAAAAGTATRPNVLFIAVDDLNTRIGCYGDGLARTPNLDRLASRGVRFERAYCQFPLCNPTRVSLLLGRYPTTTETLDFARPALLGRNWITLPQLFRENGYEAQLLGKIFHYPEPKPWSAGEEAVRQEQRQHRKMINDLTRWEPYRTLAPPTTKWVENLRTWANVIAPVADAEESNAAARAKAYEWTADVKSAEDAITLLEGWAASAKPFFLGVGFYKPHVPLVAPRRFFNLFPPDKMPLPPDFAPTPTAPDAVPRYALRYNLDLFYEERPTPERARQAIAAYYACIAFMDEKLGQVLEALERLGLRDNTVIVLWGDHGWHLGEKGMWAKGTLFDVSARAPLLLVDPRKKTAGQACPRTVQFLDIYPTLVELCGLAMPPGLEGRSLVPLLENPQASWDHPAYTLVTREDWLGRSARTERWCYTEWDKGRRGVELYDLQNDPRETKNLAPNPKYGSRIAELKKLLQIAPIAAEAPFRSVPLPDEIDR